MREPECRRGRQQAWRRPAMHGLGLYLAKLIKGISLLLREGKRGKTGEHGGDDDKHGGGRRQA